MNHCENCRYWQQATTFGQCRRRAPVLIAKEITDWPWTRKDAWCGEFDGKIETPPFFQADGTASMTEPK